MRAAVYTKYGAPEVVKVIETDTPEPEANEILVRIHAATVSRVDSIFRSGEHFFARLATGITRPRIRALGSELSGVVEAVGKEVARFKVGDAVFGSTSDFGAHAEYLCLPEDAAIVKKPDVLSHEEAAAIPYAYLTALPFLRDNGKIQAGQKVLINGASGSIGTAAIQLAKYYDTNVTAVCSGANAEFVKSLGADHVIDYTKDDFTQNSVKYDIIFDTVGKVSYNKCKRSLAPDGRYLQPDISFTILFQSLWTWKFGKKRAIFAATGLRSHEEKIADLNFLLELLESGAIKPIVDQTFPFDQIATAHAYVDKGHKKGNVLLRLEHM
jgi:NADPH:quinone reductase-like Zn-dependent oxidoreductase